MAFVEENYYVKIHAGNYVFHPDQEGWVYDMAERIERSLEDHLGP